MLAALEAGRRPSSIEPLRRLGESDEFAELFLQLLERNGWDVANPVAFAGGGVFLVADCGRFEARGQGDTLGAAVANLLHEVCTYYGVRQARPAA